MKIIVINNPAAKSGGALTILKDLLEKIKSLKCSNKFYVFVCLEELKKYETEKLKIIVIPQQGFKNRIYWDNYGLKKYLELNNIFPNLFISVQNTGVNLNKSIPQIIYYHQPLSIVDLKWNLFDKEQRIFWMYKNIYPFFINQYLDRVKKVIVQTEWVKDMFSKKFDYSLEDIALMRPEIKMIKVEDINIISKEKFRIFYPATPIIYKNHKIIIEALGELKKECKDLDKKIECIFTFKPEDNTSLYRMIKDNNLESVVKLVGKIPYVKVLEYYKTSDFMVFPSSLETFGLPLIEAQNFGIEILAYDLPYVREVIGNYKKIKYIKKDNEWKEEISKKLFL